MNNLGLTVGLFACVAFMASLLAAYNWRFTAVNVTLKNKFTVFGSFLVIAVVAGIVYAMLGHYSDWMNQRVDESRDHQLAAKITEARRAVSDKPNNIQLKLDLSALYMQGGLFEEAVKTLDKAAEQAGQRADILGLKANALYYRDGRKLTKESEEVIEDALKKNALEVNSHMLLAQDAFRHGDYPKAISHWQLLLDNNVAPERARAFNNAIANAQKRLALKQNN